MYDNFIEEIQLAWSLLQEARHDRAKLAMAIITHKQRTQSGEYCTTSDRQYLNHQLWQSLDTNLILEK